MDNIYVEVAYAKPFDQRIVALTVPVGTTVGEAIAVSHILEIYPEIDLSCQKIGIFSREVTLTDVLKKNDRVEIYRCLLTDPKEARRQRAMSVRRKK